MKDTDAEIERRLELVEECKDVDPGDRVELTWDSSRGGEITAEVKALEIPEANDGIILQGLSGDHKGQLFVDPESPENAHYGAVEVGSTAGPTPNANSTLGELLEVAYVDD